MKFSKSIYLVLILAACKTAQKPMVTTATPALDLQGHRGCRGLMPENTIPAMIKALDLGVTTLEMDLMISADKKVVVSHDPYFNENITTTPEGKTLSKGEGPSRLLYKMTYDSIRKYDVGLKPHPDFQRQQKMAAYKPLLSELLKATEGYAGKMDKPVLYNIEIKSKPQTDGQRHPPVEEFVDLAMAVINEANTGNRTVIQSFDPRALQVMHRKYPSIKTSLLVEGDDKKTIEKQVADLGFIPQYYSPHFSLVTPELVKYCHSNGMKLVPWTVNTVDGMKKLVALGVDGIISDYPDLYSQL